MTNYLSTQDRIELRKTPEGRAALAVIRALSEKLFELMPQDTERDTLRCPPPEGA